MVFRACAKDIGIGKKLRGPEVVKLQKSTQKVAGWSPLMWQMLQGRPISIGYVLKTPPMHNHEARQPHADADRPDAAPLCCRISTTRQHLERPAFRRPFVQYTKKLETCRTSSGCCSPVHLGAGVVSWYTHEHEAGRPRSFLRIDANSPQLINT